MIAFFAKYNRNGKKLDLPRKSVGYRQMVAEKQNPRLPDLLRKIMDLLLLRQCIVLIAFVSASVILYVFLYEIS